jgi:hypothetical protein
MASEIKVDTISEKTSAGGVTIDGLLIKDGGISGDVSLIGTTPTFTIGDAGAEDATLLFDGNAQDFYIALDDSADDLLIGKGSTVGTTPAISIDSDLKVNIPVTTASTSASTGSLITGGGMGVGADLYVGDDTYLITDSAVLGFGADKDTLLTHTDGTGLTLNSTNKLCFNDTSQFVQGSSATVLSIGATDEIDLTATAIDINGTCDISGTFSLGGTNITTTAAEINLIDGGTSRGTTAIADGDGVLINDGGTMRQTTVETLATYIGGGITASSQWRTNAEATGGISPITAWEEADAPTGFGVLGSSMTESSGIFTFPSTGYWKILFVTKMFLDGDSRFNNNIIKTTHDNSTYADASYNSCWLQQTAGAASVGNSITEYIFDVVSTSNYKCQFVIDVANASTTTGGYTLFNQTFVTFTRLGDT